MKELRYLGRVASSGAIVLPKRLAAEVRAMFAGREFIAIFRTATKKRSSDQNRYYWGVILPMLAGAFQDAGNAISPNNPDDLQNLHDFLKQRYLPPRILADRRGEGHELPPSTAALSTTEFAEYTEQVRQFAIEYFSLNIPDPGEQSTLSL